MTNLNPIDKPITATTTDPVNHEDRLSLLPEPSDEATTPLRVVKKDNMKAWTLTLVLHLLIAGLLVGYWYFYQRPKNHDNLQIKLQSQTQTVKTAAVEPQTASNASLSTLSSVASATMSAAAASTPTLTASTTSERPLGSYLNTHQTAPTAAPVPVPAPAMPNTIQKVIVHEAPVTKALTNRDMPSRELSNNTSPQKSPKPATETATKAKTPVPEAEAQRLSDEIDVDNAELTKLIEQVKTQNQQKIDAATQTAPVAKAAEPTPAPTEKSEPAATAPRDETSAPRKSVIVTSPDKIDGAVTLETP